MKYMLTIFAEEPNWEEIPPEQAAASMAAWDSYTRGLNEAGAFVAGEGLAPSLSATTIRLTEDPIVTDGPYAETKEQLAGFYLIDVDDLDAALEWARKIPLPGGAVEVRSVIDYEEHRTTEVAS